MLTLQSALLLFTLPTTAFANLVGIGLHPIGDRIPGTPKGEMKNINGIDTYVSLPKSGHYDRKEAVLFLTDVFGLPLVNSKLLADQWAEAGYAVYAPDYLFNDTAPLDDPTLGNWDIAAWLQHHGPDVTLPAIHAVQDFLKESGVKKFAATGYCFGGLYTLLLSRSNEINVGTTAHPSLWQVPEDLLAFRNTSHVPLQVQTAEFDTFLTPALADIVDDVLLGHGNWSSLSPYKYGYERVIYNGVGHGFAVRPANASDPFQVATVQKAFKKGLGWVRRHL